VIHGDGGELDSNAIKKYCRTHEPNQIEYTPSPPHTQALNGQAERPLGIVRGRAQCALGTSNLPQRFFNYAMDYSVHTNRALVHRRPQLAKLSDIEKTDKPKRGLSPYEQVHGKMPDYSRFHPFGCLVAVYIDKKLRTSVFNELERMKLLKGNRTWKAEPGIFLGYKSQRIAHIYLYRTQRVHEVFHFRPCKHIFPGLTLQAHHINPLLTWNTFGLEFSDAELEGENGESEATPATDLMNGK
jgi:hypothetical protein